MTESNKKCVAVTDAEFIPERRFNVIGICTGGNETLNPLRKFALSLNIDGSGFAMIQCLDDLPQPDERFQGAIKPLTAALTRDVDVQQGALINELPLVMTPGWQQKRAEEFADAFEGYCQTGLPIAKTTVTRLPKK